MSGTHKDRGLKWLPGTMVCSQPTKLATPMQLIANLCHNFNFPSAAVTSAVLKKYTMKSKSRRKREGRKFTATIFCLFFIWRPHWKWMRKCGLKRAFTMRSSFFVEIEIKLNLEWNLHRVNQWHFGIWSSLLE